MIRERYNAILIQGDHLKNSIPISQDSTIVHRIYEVIAPDISSSLKQKEHHVYYY